MRTTSYSKVKLNVSVGAEVMQQIETLASIRNMKKAELIRALITEYVDSNQDMIAQYIESKAKADEALAKLGATKLKR